MTNQEALIALTDLEAAISIIKEAINTDAGYATVGECERLGQAWADLQDIIENNNWNNIPF